MAEDRNIKNEAEAANRKLSEGFTDYGVRTTSSVKSETEKVNQEIQEQFYEEEEVINSLPFHVDINNPPIKK